MMYSFVCHTVYTEEEGTKQKQLLWKYGKLVRQSRMMYLE